MSGESRPHGYPDVSARSRPMTILLCKCSSTVCRVVSCGRRGNVAIVSLIEGGGRLGGTGGAAE